MPVVDDYTALLSGASVHGAANRSAFYTYSFSSSVPSYYTGAFSAAGLATFQPFTEAEKAVARQALQAFAASCGLTFFEVPSGEGDIEFGSYNLDLMGHGGVAGVGYYPSGPFDNQFASDVQIDLNQAGSLSLMLHEIGHALGLKHPHEGNVTLNPALDNHATTVMSYLGPPANNLGPLDLQALEHLYGNAGADGSHVASWSWDQGTRTLTQTGFSFSETLVGVGSIDVIFGMDGDDIIHGRGGNDRLEGGEGADQLRGGVGNDVLIGGNGNDKLEGDDGNDRLEGGAGNDSIFAWTGNDTLYGGAGFDFLFGAAGDDNYLIEDSLDQIFEDSGEGYDTVYALVNFTLTAGAEIEAFTVYDRGTVNPINLTGNAFAQIIYGNNGANSIYSGGGADTIYSLGGDDSILVESTSAIVIEVAGQGYDTVYAIGDFYLNNFSFVEALSVYDRGTGNACTLFGNNLDNVIYGNQGSNALLGGGGEDTLYGLGGDDRYFVDSLGDQVIEAANAGNDTIYTTLGSYQLITDQQVETLTVYDRDTTYAATLTGNNLVQFIYGNAGANTIDGKGGADTLYGMAGQDTFTFTNAPIAGAPDMLADFSAADDTIALDDIAFLGIGLTGALNANAFVTGSAATSAAHRIVYNQATGQLLFDADGNGAGAAVHFATVNAGTVLTAGDFTVI